MPGNEGSVPWKLNEPIRAPHQQVGAKNTLHGIQNPRMRNHLINPGEREMGETINRAPLSRNQFAQTPFVRFCVVVEVMAESLGFTLAENSKRAQVAILFVKLPLVAAQHCRPSLQKRPNQPCQVVRLR